MTFLWCVLFRFQLRFKRLLIADSLFPNTVDNILLAKTEKPEDGSYVTNVDFSTDREVLQATTRCVCVCGRGFTKAQASRNRYDPDPAKQGK